MGQTQYIVAGSLIDGAGSEIRRKVYLAVKDTNITEIGPAADILGNSDLVVDDLSHCTILPPMVDASVLLSRSPSIGVDVDSIEEKMSHEQRASFLKHHMRDCFMHGVLGVASGDDPVIPMDHSLQMGEMLSEIVIRTSGHIYPDSIDRKAENLNSFDFVKVHYSTGIGNDEISPPSVPHRGFMETLRGNGLKKVVAIANGPERVKEAIELGCDAIEQGYGMGMENLQTMADQGVMWIPSVLLAKNGLDSVATGGDVCCRFSQRYVAPGKPVPGAAAFWKRMLEGQLSQLRLARELGVKTVLGTGAGSIGILHGESMVEEMKLFIKAGYSLGKTLQCASENGADFFAMKTLGPLQVGSKATFLVTRGTPQQLPRKLSFLENIYVDGIPSAAYKKNPDIVPSS